MDQKGSLQDGIVITKYSTINKVHMLLDILYMMYVVVCIMQANIYWIFGISPEHVDGLMQERHNSIANALGLRISCINPSMHAK